MKKRLFVLMIIVFSVFLSGSYYDDSLKNNLSISNEKIDDDIFDDGSSDILSKLGLDEIDSKTLQNISFSEIMNIFLDSFRENIKQPLKTVTIVLSFGIICLLLKEIGFAETDRIMDPLCAVFAAVYLIMPLKNTISAASEIISECSDFMICFIPIYSATAVATGYASSALSYHLTVLGASTAVSEIFSGIVVPLVSMFFVMSIVSVFSDIDVKEITNSVKNFASGIITFSMIIFTSILGLKSLISFSADTIGLKTAKFIVGGAIPVVGGAVSDCLSSALACLKLTKNVLGTYAIIVIAIIFLPVVAKLLIWRIALTVGKIVGELFGMKKLPVIFAVSDSVISIMMAALVSICLMFIFSSTILLIAGVGIG